MNRSSSIRIVSSVLLLLAVVSTHAACSSEENEATPGAGQDDAGPAPTNPGPITDAGLDADKEGEVIGEGGDLPDVIPDDAASEEVGPDGGLVFQPGCLLPVAGPFVATTCSNRLSTYTSAGLVSGTYVLTSVEVKGSTAFCSDVFKVYEHAGALAVTASSPANANLRFYDKYRSQANPLATSVNRYSVDVTASGTDLTFGAPVCAAGTAAPAAGKFSSGIKDGKKYITLRLPYGATGSAMYRFSEL